MKIVFLGTNGWYSTETGDTVSTLIETDDFYVLFDAGESFRKLNKYLIEEKPVYLFLSHFHLDHVYGLHMLDRLGTCREVNIVFEKSRRKDFLNLVESPYTVPYRNLPFKVNLVEVREGLSDKLPFPVVCKKLYHKDVSHGFRADVGGKKIAYCLDTGPGNSCYLLAEGCDVLIHECTLSPGKNDAVWGHTGPEEAARVAKKAGVGKLILTHFMPDYYPYLNSRKEAEREARRIFSNTFAANDEMVLEL